MAKPQYGAAHRAEKERWRLHVEAGAEHCRELVCLLPHRWIPPGSEWDLAHDHVNGGYLGPAHAVCNRSEGASRAHRPREPRRWAI